METNNSNNQLVHSDNYMQMMPIEQAQAWYNQFGQFVKSILKEELDFGVIPGCQKPSLYKPGAEKLRFVYGLGVEFEPIEHTVDLKTPFIDYTYRCIIKSKNGQVLSQCEGNCNSMEAKFGYLWVAENEVPDGVDKSKLKSKTTGKKISEFDFAINKAETTGQYGKPQEYWNKWVDAINSGKAKKIIKKSKAGKELDAYEINEEVTVYRILNPDVVGLKNTIMKMAQKRAFVGAILIATGASEYFTQDVEDMEINGAIYSDVHTPTTEDVEYTEVKQEPKQEARQESKKQKLSDKAFADALKRIDAGESELIGKLAGTYALSSEQQSLLEERTTLFTEPQTN
jgi:hypothetical protein